MCTAHAVETVRPRGRLLASVAAVAVAAATARAQCPTDVLVSPDGGPYVYFGEAIAIAGDRAVVTQVFDDDAGSNVGAAFALDRAGDTWTFRQKLLPSVPVPHMWYGLAAATDGDRIVVASIHRDTPSGEVYVYRFDPETATWAEEARLLAEDAEERRFGYAVAIEGPLLAVGAPDDTTAGPDAGAVYVFRHDGAVWTGPEKLLASDGGVDHAFGTSLRVADGALYVGAPGAEGRSAGEAAGACYVLHDDGGWLETAKLVAPDGEDGDRYGIAVAVDAATLVIGADRHEPTDGAAYVLRHDGAAWQEEAMLTASDESSVGFGGAVDASGDAVTVGLTRAFGRSGRAYVFRDAGGTWPATSIRPIDGNSADYFGNPIAVDGDALLIGAPHHTNENGFWSGTVRTYAIAPLSQDDCNCNGVPDAEDVANGTSDDCDGNGVPDECEDCNDNGIGDACDIAAGTSEDCNENGVPDLCDIGWRDSNDANGDGVPDECQTLFRWIEVHWFAGRQWFEHGYVERWTFRIYALFTEGQANGVTSVFGIQNRPLFIEAVGTDDFYNDPFGGLTAPIDIRRVGQWSSQWDTYVTIGAVAAHGDETRLSPGFAEMSGGLTGNFTSENIGWFVYPGEPQGRPDENGRVLLAQFSTPCGTGISGMFNLLLMDGTSAYEQYFWAHPEELREVEGIAASGVVDCNQNCLDDTFDIYGPYGGPSRDCNRNGTPDECEGLACVYADLDCDGEVAFYDLLAVLSAWGPCAVCDEDIDASGAVDFADVLAVLADWGGCV